MQGTCLDLKHSVHLLNASLVNVNNAWGQNLNMQVLLKIEALLRLAWVNCGISGCCDKPRGTACNATLCLVSGWQTEGPECFKAAT